MEYKCFDPEFLGSTYYTYFGKVLQDIQINPTENLNIEIPWAAINEKACFNNARLIAQYHNCCYVEGEVKLLKYGVFIEHAWNKINDKYFDCTFEKFGNLDDISYYPIVEGNLFELNKEYDLNSHITLCVQYLNQKINRNIIENANSIYNYLKKMNQPSSNVNS